GINISSNLPLSMGTVVTGGDLRIIQAKGLLQFNDGANIIAKNGGNIVIQVQHLDERVLNGDYANINPLSGAVSDGIGNPIIDPLTGQQVILQDRILFNPNVSVQALGFSASNLAFFSCASGSGGNITVGLGVLPDVPVQGGAPTTTDGMSVSGLVFFNNFSLDSTSGNQNSTFRLTGTDNLASADGGARIQFQAPVGGLISVTNNDVFNGAKLNTNVDNLNLLDAPDPFKVDG